MPLVFTQPLVYLVRRGSFVDNPQPPTQANFVLGAESFNFGFAQCGAIQFDLAVMLESPFVDSTTVTPIQLPPNADPPFPPVWPYTWDPSLIYGRENLTQNLRVVRGDDLRFIFRIVADGGAVDLTGGDLTLTARYAVDEAVLFTCTVGDGLTVPDPTDGYVHTVISSFKTSEDIPLHTVPLVYDVEFINSAGLISTVLYGVITVYPNVTELP